MNDGEGRGSSNEAPEATTGVLGCSDTIKFNDDKSNVLDQNIIEIEVNNHCQHKDLTPNNDENRDNTIQRVENIDDHDNDEDGDDPFRREGENASIVDDKMGNQNDSEEDDRTEEEIKIEKEKSKLENDHALTLIPDPPNPLDIPRFCHNCDVPQARYSCSKCKKIHYCSQGCQRDDWSNHRKICNALSIFDRPGKPSIQEFSYGRHHLGDGNYSSISICTHISTGQVFAIKCIEKQKIKRVKYRHKDVEKEILMEKNILLKLNHPMIVKLYYTMQDQFNLYFLLEAVHGGELWEKMRDDKTEEVIGLYPSQIPFYICQMVIVLEYIHSQGIVHRDFKPENIMLTRCGHIKVIDFGTAKNLHDDTYNGTEFKGTAEYMSPEAVNNQPVGTAADLWALGNIIYQSYLGTPPFKSGSPYLTFQRIIRRQFTVPEYLDPTVIDLIDKLIQIKPENRLGYGKNGYDELKNHPFFKGINWTNILYETTPKIDSVDYKIEFIAQQLIEKNISNITSYPTKIQNGVKLYLHRIKKLKELSIFQSFFENTYEARFHLLYNHIYRGREHFGNSIFVNPFSVLVISSPNIGIGPNNNKLTNFIKRINILKPKLLVIIGSLCSVDCRDPLYEEYSIQLKEILSTMDHCIDLYIIPSQNDFGSTIDDMTNYIKRYGDYYSTYWYSGLNIYSLNSSLLLNDIFKEQNNNQLLWLEEEMFISKIGSHHLFLFSEHNLFPKTDQKLSSSNNTIGYNTITARSGVQLNIYSESNDDTKDTFHFEDIPKEKEDKDNAPQDQDTRTYQYINLSPYNLHQTVLVIRLWQYKMECDFTPFVELDSLELSNEDENY